MTEKSVNPDLIQETICNHYVYLCSKVKRFILFVRTGPFFVCPKIKKQKRSQNDKCDVCSKLDIKFVAFLLF